MLSVISKEAHFKYNHYLRVVFENFASHVDDLALRKKESALR